MVILQGVLQRAVVWQKIPTNPVRAVAKPKQRRQLDPRPLAPASVEALRSRLAQRDATLVSVLAYAGLRPGEALALTWGDMGRQTITVTKAISVGGEKATKTGRGRSVRLLAPLASDLAAWRLASGRPDDAVPVFPRRDGALWRDTDWRNWRRRTFHPAAEKAEVGPLRPYDLRHAFVSLLLREGLSVVDIARQAGHSPTMTTSTYAHLIDELEGTERRSAEAEIRAARDKLVSSECPRGDAAGAS
jgi:integrase